jgi:hypothetical protein
MLWCNQVPANCLTGHSQASASIPKQRLTTCRIGIGLTAESKLVVRKSQKNLGQKKASNDAAI